MNNGYIKLWRDLLEKPIWLNSTPQQKTILITLLLIANHKTKSWEWNCEKFVISPGQFVTSIDSIKSKCGKGISTQNIKTGLKRFQKLEFLTNKSTKMGRIITIMNWDSYQPKNKKLTKDLTVDQPTINRRLTPNKNERMKEEILTGKFALDFFAPEINGWDKKELEKTIDGFIFLRKQKKISSGVLENEMEYWHKFPDEIINISLKTYNLKKYWEDSKGEKYLRGIIRGKSKNVNKQNSQSLSQKAF